MSTVADVRLNRVAMREWEKIQHVKQWKQVAKRSWLKKATEYLVQVLGKGARVF